jgi:hypothetical protein
MKRYRIGIQGVCRIRNKFQKDKIFHNDYVSEFNTYIIDEIFDDLRNTGVLIRKGNLYKYEGVCL